MDVIKADSIVAYRIDGEEVCCSCVSDEEEQDVRADEIITVTPGNDLVFCDRCEKKIG